ncbi:MAG: PhoX family phosphatase [Candidatus Competibacterales bacterium]
MNATPDKFCNRAEAFEASEDQGRSPGTAPTLGEVVSARFSRRDLLKGALAASVMSGMAATPLATLVGRRAEAADQTAERFAFEEIAHGVDENHHVAPGYDADILIRWGDPVLADAPPFDPHNQTADAQEKQFGYNNDYLGFVPLAEDRALLCVNHEYTNEEVMFPGLGRQDKQDFIGMTPELCEIEMAAHGGSIVEIARDANGKWSVVKDSAYARRISPRSTPMKLSGPAAGNPRMKPSADPSGPEVVGTLNNCAGGITPWGTYLMAEENFHGYFWGELGDDHPEKTNYARYGVPGNWYAWGKFFDRFDIVKEPNEANRFGWVVEVDPRDPQSTPVKRTALGRYKHEGSESIVNKDGRVVLYMGDDERFDYLYKFVSKNAYNPDDRAANKDLLDEGTLFVAQFHEDGKMVWLPLVFGENGLTPENGFNNQGDVLIETRRAADLLGATPMDRPEDVEPNPVTHKVYVMLTNNSRRTPEQTDAVNDRAANIWGQIVELTPPGDDHGATEYQWDILVKAGNPNDEAVAALWNPATSENGWFACPDNCAVDNAGRLWVTTDQGSGWSKASGTADGVWALETEGEKRGTGKMFFRVPVGAEMCGPKFTPDDQALFVAVQHPATDGTKDFPGFERDSTFEDPATRWPDFDPNMPPRPSVLVITKQGGGKIAS